MECCFRPHDRDRMTESMEGSLLGFGPLWKGCWAAKREAFAVTWLTVGVPNDLQMARNLTGGLPMLYQGRLANLVPFRECLIPAHEKRQKGAPEDIGVPDCKTGNGEMLGCMRRTRMQNEMHMMT